MWPARREIPDLKELFEPAALAQIGAEILNGGPPAIRYAETRRGGESMVFVAHHADVVRVLTDEQKFSLCKYASAYSAVAPAGASLVMRPASSDRCDRLAIMWAAAAATPWFGIDPTARRDLVRTCVNDVIAVVERQRSFDLMADYGFFVPYLVAKRVLGVGTPRSFSLLPLICLMNCHPLSKIFAPRTKAFFANIAWSQVLLAQVLKNFESRNRIFRLLAPRGEKHLRKQIEHEVDAASKTASAEPLLLNALWAVRDSFGQIDNDTYRDHVVSIMMELVGTILPTPGLAFSEIIDRWLGPGGSGLKESLRPLGVVDAETFAQEQLRLAPPTANLLRIATGPVELGGLTLREGDYVCALVKSAGGDTDEPQTVKAGRCPSTYVHFGPETGPHRCFGHLLATSMLAEMFLGLNRLPELTPQSNAVKSFKGTVPGRLIVRVGTPP